MCQACFLESTECFLESTLGTCLGTCQSHPPPMQAHEPSGQKGGTTCTSPKPVEPIIMLPALARRSSTSAGKPRPTQKYHLCRQASPDAELIGARLPRTKQTLPAIMPDAARD